MAKKPLVVVGHRMGKGMNIAQGLEAGGAEVIRIEGMLADMKLGDKMNEVNADLGISFCGSGGAGALSAATKYGYKEKHGNNMIKAYQFKDAIKEGCKVVGGNFAADTVENGLAVMEAYFEKYGRE